MGRYQAAGSGSGDWKTHTEPKALPVEAFSRATAPAKQVIQPRPWYILINGQSANPYTFLYETSCSIGGTSAGETYTAALDLASAANAPVKLDINPVAWSGGGGDLGDVTFIYRGGL